jgi:ABC-type transport system substrate-binding protein
VHDHAHASISLLSGRVREQPVDPNASPSGVAVGDARFCAAPSDTPTNPNLRRVVRSAGPYYVTSNMPGQEVTLTRNPKCRGARSHHFAHIELMVRVPAARAIHEIESGT